MKSNTYIFDIPIPCHEKWNNMIMKVDTTSNEMTMIGLLVYKPKDQTLYNIVRHKIRKIAHNLRSNKKAKKQKKAENKTAAQNKNIVLEIPANNSKEIKNKINDFSGKIYPNPFSNNINLEFNYLKNELLIIRLLDLNGRIVFSKNYEAIKGVNKFLLTPDLQNISANNYLLEVSGSAGLYFAEMVVYSNGN